MEGFHPNEEDLLGWDDGERDNEESEQSTLRFSHREGEEATHTGVKSNRRDIWSRGSLKGKCEE